MMDRPGKFGVVTAAMALILAAFPLQGLAATRVGGGCTASQRGRTVRVGGSTLRCERESSGRTVRFVWRRVPTPAPANTNAQCLVPARGFVWVNRDPATFGRLLSGGPVANRIEITEFTWTVNFIGGEMVQNIAARGTATGGITVDVDYGSRAAYTPTPEGFTINAVLERQGSFVLSASSGSTTTPLTLPIGEVGGSNATACSGNNLVIDFAGPSATVQILFDKRPL